MIGSVPLPLASIEDVFFPCLAVFAALMLPVMFIMTRHQQRMTELMGRQSSQLPALNEVSELKHEVQQLREVIANLSHSVGHLNEKSSQDNQIEARIKGIE